MSNATDVLDRLAERDQQAAAEAATRYRDLILSGGPTEQQATELQSLMVALGLSPAAVKADIAAVAKLKAAERQYADDYGDADAQAKRQADHVAAINALNDFIDILKRQERERQLRSVVSDAEFAIRRANNAAADLRQAREDLSDRLAPRGEKLDEPEKSPGGQTIHRRTIVIDDAAALAERTRQNEEQAKLARLQEERSQPRPVSVA